MKNAKTSSENGNNSGFTLNHRLLLLQGLFVGGIVLIIVACGWMQRLVERRVIFPNFENQILNGHKDTLRSLVQNEAQVLAERLKPARTRAEQMAIIEAETDPIRFFDDKSGYFFTYDTNGVRVDVPINKAQNGQNLMELKDSAGVAYVRAFVETAAAGGGFVQYHFEKAGHGIQPKLSYAAMIPGTDFLLGTGVYIDDVQSERLALAHQIDAQTSQYFIYIAGLCVVILALTLGGGLLVSVSIRKGVQEVARGLWTSAVHVTQASAQLSQTSQSLAAGSSEQAASIEETSASLEQASSTTKRNVENVHTAKELARQTREAADRGVQDTQSMSQAMDAIKTSSNDIAKIIKAIDEIAFQTNILALNAAVEAARAGEAGMGFAVVADEVRSLAQRSAEAAKETASKIEGAINKTNLGVAMSGKAAAALNEILAKARQMDDLATEIAAAAKEQASGIDQINQAVAQMDKVTQTNAANAEETAASAEELNAQAETMRYLVANLDRLVGRHTETAGAAPERNGSPHPEKPPRKLFFSRLAPAPEHPSPPAEEPADIPLPPTHRRF